MTTAFASGLIGNDGNIISAQNIKSCDHKGKGNYMVNYDASFTAGPGAQATVWGDGLRIGLNILAENTCEVLIQDSSGNPTDSGFSFFVPSNQ